MINYKKKYGKSIVQIASSLGITRQAVSRLANRGALEYRLRGQRKPRKHPKTSDSKYRRAYGMSLGEIADMLNTSAPQVAAWHKRGILQEAIDFWKNPLPAPEHFRLVLRAKKRAGTDLLSSHSA
jgi:DNA-binding CsgD family transcriptional regulator